MDDETEHLHRVPAFADLETAKLKLLAFAGARASFTAGEVVYRQGETGDAVYVILEGTAEIVLEGPFGERVIARLRENDIAGEVAVLCNVPRTATLRAADPMTALVLSGDIFVRLVTETPTVGLAFMRMIAGRYGRTIARLLADAEGGG